MRYKMIIGLGNPDPQYQNTYHNVGHLFIDYLKSQMSDIECQMLKSDVYMNESGKFVSRQIKKIGIKLEELLIAHDDSDITLGNFKLSYSRGAAGHHGIENIMATLKTKNLWRIRIGIRPPKEKIRQKAENFVLKKISAANKKLLEGVFEKASGEII